MKNVRTLLVVLALAAAVAASLVSAGGAAAAGGTHTLSLSDTFHGIQTDSGPNPCTGGTVDLSETTNSVFHITLFPGSDELWATFTEEDQVSAVDEQSGVVYSGHSTFWGNENVNEQNSNYTFTGVIHVIGSDGSSLLYHEVEHVTLLPSGNVAVSFDKPSITCG
jgi:hypothetical protein